MRVQHVFERIWHACGINHDECAHWWVEMNFAGWTTEIAWWKGLADSGESKIRSLKQLIRAKAGAAQLNGVSPKSCVIFISNLLSQFLVILEKLCLTPMQLSFGLLGLGMWQFHHYLLAVKWVIIYNVIFFSWDLYIEHFAVMLCVDQLYLLLSREELTVSDCSLLLKLSIYICELYFGDYYHDNKGNIWCLIRYSVILRIRFIQTDSHTILLLVVLIHELYIWAKVALTLAYDHWVDTSF